MPGRPLASRAAVPTYEGRPLPDPTEPVYDQGLAFDVETLLGRRSVLKLIGLGSVSAAAFVVAACTPGSSPSGPAAASAAGSADSRSCEVIPEETAGPFPGDGSNGPDVLSESGVVRQDIRSSFGTSSTVAQGIPLTIMLVIQDLASGCSPFAGAAVYLWHCDREGRYSMYSSGVEGENYLRGVQAAESDGVITFTSIFPGCYPGRWPHIHFEVYPSLEAAADEANRIATSQIALPESTSAEVYATDGYEQSVTDLASLSLATDGVFGEDGGARQLGTISGSPTTGLTVELAVPVRVG